MTEAFKRIEVPDVRNANWIATFERPSPNSDTILITTPGAPFHLDAGTLRTIALLLDYSPSKKTIV